MAPRETPLSGDEPRALGLVEPSEEGTEDSERTARHRQRKDALKSLALMVAWCPAEPWRVGEVLLLPPRDRQARVFGRAPRSSGNQVRLVRQRPGVNASTDPLGIRKLSRSQLLVRVPGGGALAIENVGKAELRVGGIAVEQAHVAPGQCVELRGQLLLACVVRPFMIPELRHCSTPPHAWGRADDDGFVGETPAAWAVRDSIHFVARRAGHVLVLGPSGVGKELVARALHRRSERSHRPLIARNAATIPETLMAAELFGHVRDYPNPGMSDREGLVGQAQRSTLFLDEIGELPDALQAHLLRLMDGGDYQRLGEGHARVADVRIVGATNRARSELKSDLTARFRHVIDVPPLSERSEDLPLLVHHLLSEALRGEDRLADRFMVRAADGARYPRVSCRLIEALLRHPLPLQVRELESILWRCLGGSNGDTVDLVAPLSDFPPPARAPLLLELTPEVIKACLDKHNGVQERVWRELGLANRYVLRRLIYKHGLGGSNSGATMATKNRDERS